MEYNTHFMRAELKNLKCNLFSNIWLFILISIINIIFFKIMYFLHKAYTALYLICTIIYILFIFFSIFPLILLYKKYLFNFRKILLLKKSSFFFIFTILIIGIIFNVVIFLNIHNLFTFNKECPYNFSYKDIALLFDINYNKPNLTYDKYSKKCQNKICLLIGENFENGEIYSYLCNFDSSLDFDSFSIQIARKIFSKNNIKQEDNNKIKCNLFSYDENKEIIDVKNDQNFFIIKSFHDICSSGCLFYKCDRYEKPKNYQIDYDFECPIIYETIILLIIGLFSIIFNFFCPIILYLIQFFIIKKILRIFLRINGDLHSTKVSINENTKISKIKNNNSNDINSNTIIIEPNREEQNDNKEILIKIRKVHLNENQGENNETTKSERRKIIMSQLYDNESNNKNNEIKSNNSIQFQQINLNDNFDNINQIKKEDFCLTEYNIPKKKDIEFETN